MAFENRDAGGHVAILALAGLDTSCSPEGATSSEAPVNSVEQAWYSTDPYDQHGEMLDDAVPRANLVAAVNGLGWPLFDLDALKRGNKATDHTDESANTAIFEHLYGARRDSQNHSFLRDGGTESAYHACARARADMIHATDVAINEYWQMQSAELKYFFDFIIGHVTHTIQDSYAPAHARRDTGYLCGSNTIEDVCSIHWDIPGACRHPCDDAVWGSYFPCEQDDADNNPVLATCATDATYYLRLSSTVHPPITGHTFSDRRGVTI